MSASRHCPDCGATLPKNSPQGLCPKCLLRVGTDDASASSLDEPTLVVDSDSVANGGVEPATEPDLGDLAEPPEIGARVHYFGDYELWNEMFH